MSTYTPRSEHLRVLRSAAAGRVWKDTFWIHDGNVPCHDLALDLDDLGLIRRDGAHYRPTELGVEVLRRHVAGEQVTLVWDGVRWAIAETEEAA